jgi:hypothetical protein
MRVGHGAPPEPLGSSRACGRGRKAPEVLLITVIMTLRPP